MEDRGLKSAHASLSSYNLEIGSSREGYMECACNEENRSLCMSSTQSVVEIHVAPSKTSKPVEK